MPQFQTTIPQEVSQLIEMALSEDIRDGDVTSEYFVPVEQTAHGVIVARDEGYLSGIEIALEVFRRIDSELELTAHAQDGDFMKKGSRVLEIKGNARSILTGERTALNFLQRLCGIASKTNRFVQLTEGTKARILDTRKTTPGWRWLEKSAVKAGGGLNHRMGLYDRAMVKDNHLVAEGGLPVIQHAINKLKAEKPNVEVELEADNLDQVKSFLGLEGVDHILLDNMSLDQLREAVSLRGDVDTPKLEASGGVNLTTVEGISQTGVDFISVGALTHSAVALDLAMDFLEASSV